MSHLVPTDLSRKLFAGAISGTSVDGLDVALVYFEDSGTDKANRAQLLAARTVDFPAKLRDLLVRLTAPSEHEIYHLGSASTALGRFIGTAILELLESVNLSPLDVCAIGSHGQTIRHHPEGTDPFTIQIGNPSAIVETTGITTVADFRSRDIAAGGQGAPLACAYHRYLFARPGQDLAVLNLGGFANVTCLFADGRTLGFDTGPANALMDSWVLAETGMLWDEGGELAMQGEPLEALLEKCLQDPYFSTQPPKSTGREYFNLDWLRARIKLVNHAQDASLTNMLATLIRLSAQSIADALERIDFEPENIWVCGGGRHNRALMMALSELLDGRTATIEDAGVDGDSLEAVAFAWLARECLHGRVGNLPPVTGATGSRILGAIYPA